MVVNDLSDDRTLEWNDSTGYKRGFVARTPARIKVKAGDVVTVTGTTMFHPHGEWVVQGDERIIKFKLERLERYYRYQVDLGSGEFVAGYQFHIELGDIEPGISQEEFDAVVSGTTPLRLLYARFCKKVHSLDALLNRTDVWVLDLDYTSISDTR